MRELYTERLSVLLEGAREKLAGMVEISSVEAGLQTIGWLRRGLSAERVSKLAAARKVEIVPVNRYAFGHARREGVVLGFAAVDPRELRRGVDELAQVLNAQHSAG